MEGVEAPWRRLWRWISAFFAAPPETSAESPQPKAPEPNPAPVDRKFSRVLEPVDPWLDPQSSDEVLSEKFKGKHDKMSVACLDSCAATRVLASFYGPATYILPAFPHHFPFMESEARAAGAVLEHEDAIPPWPPEYSSAHHNLQGNQLQIAREMVGLHRAQKRSVEIPRCDVLDDICCLLARSDVHQAFKTNGQKHIRRLLKSRVEMLECWLPLAEKHEHLLDDPSCQKVLRELNESDPDVWKKYAERLPRVKDDQRFRSTKKK